jgi:hypothetical protein
MENLLNDTKRKRNGNLKNKKLFVKKRIFIIFKSLTHKEYRTWILKRISDKNWRNLKLTQLGLKKPKPKA